MYLGPGAGVSQNPVAGHHHSPGMTLEKMIGVAYHLGDFHQCYQPKRINTTVLKRGLESKGQQRKEK